MAISIAFTSLNSSHRWNAGSKQKRIRTFLGGGAGEKSGDLESLRQVVQVQLKLVPSLFPFACVFLGIVRCVIKPDRGAIGRDGCAKTQCGTVRHFLAGLRCAFNGCVTREKTMRSRRGLVLVIVLLIGLVLMVMSITLFGISTTRSGATVSRRDNTTTQQQADSASLLVQGKLLEDFQQSGLTRSEWMQRLQLPPQNLLSRYQANANRPDLQPYLQISSKNLWNAPGLIPVASAAPVVTVARVFADKNLEVQVTAYLKGASQTVVRTLQGTDQETLRFALAAKAPHCQFCHLQVQGDVAVLSSLWPQQPLDAVLDSEIKGNLYSYQPLGEAIKSVHRSPSNQNFAPYYGPQFSLWRGSDVNGDGWFNDFPPIDPAAFGTSAGSVEGNVQVVPVGGHFESYNPGRLQGPVQGHAVLVGDAPSPANQYCRKAQQPLKIDGDLFIQGDLVIKGCIAGQGRLYSARNIYIAGDLVYVHDLPSAQESLGLLANGSIILGDYTEQSAGGVPKLYRDQLGAHYLRARFGLPPGKQVALEANAPLFSELIQDLQGNYRRLSGAVVDKNSLQFQEGYDALIRPAAQWLSDKQYTALLGDAVPGSKDSVSTWRIDPKTYVLAGDTLWNLAHSQDPKKIQILQAFFVQNLQFGSSASAHQDAVGRTQGILDQLKMGVSGWSEMGYTYFDSDLQLTIFNRIPNTKGFDYDVPRPVQIQRIDGFLYSPHRIGGVVNGTNLVINGAMSTPDAAITAPGIGTLQAAWTENQALKKRLIVKGQQSNPLQNTSYNYGAILYDERLRNLPVRYLSRLNAAEQMQFKLTASPAKVCRNAQCN
jgi:hypothetical protein